MAGRPETPRDVIATLCAAQEAVCRGLLGASQPNDCVCGRGGFWTPESWPTPSFPWRSSGEAAAYVLAAAKFCALSGIPREHLERVVARLEEENTETGKEPCDGKV